MKSLRNRTKRASVPRILILGLDNAGKTTILRKLNGEEAQPSEGPTQGFNQKEVAVHDRAVKLCDLGGQRSLRDFWQDYYEACDCLMYVVDSSDIRRLEESHATFMDVIQNLQRVPILVFANKQDLVTARTPAELAECLQLTDCRDRMWHIQGCSARTGEGLEEGVMWVLQNCSAPPAPVQAAPQEIQQQ
jgi:Arf/Sar family protein